MCSLFGRGASTQAGLAGGSEALPPEGRVPRRGGAGPLGEGGVATGRGGAPGLGAGDPGLATSPASGWGVQAGSAS